MMKKIAVIAIMLVFCTVSIGFPCELTVRVTEKSYPPFFVDEENGKWSGLSIELVEALLQEAGCKATYKPLPFKRALMYLKQGKTDMMLNLTITAERKAFIHFIGPQLDETVILVIRKDSDFSLTSLDDIKKLSKPVGVERGKVYGTAFEEKRATDEAFKNNIDIVNNLAANEKKLEKNRLSGFLGYGYNVFYRFKTEPLYQNFAVHPLKIHQDWVHFGFSKKSVPAEMLQRLQEAYDRVKQKGVFDKIRQAYIVK